MEAQKKDEKRITERKFNIASLEDEEREREMRTICWFSKRIATLLDGIKMCLIDIILKIFPFADSIWVANGTYVHTYYEIGICISKD